MTKWLGSLVGRWVAGSRNGWMSKWRNYGRWGRGGQVGDG